MSDKPETVTPVVAAAAAAAEPAASVAAEPAASEAASSSSSADADENEVAPEEESTAVYEPVMKLAIVEVSSGEENDEVLYKQRAALYRFDSGEWKERGRGDVKLLQNKESKKIRIILRQEKTLKACMNHLVHHEVELKPNAGSDRSWTWRVVDYANGEAEEQTFAIRFKDSETANAFKAEHDKARESNKPKA